ncbi:MAG: hypothetical protein HY225_03910 [Candidatus Vogelbacteria bacterium]|nr:hypothetical protein [Candidatus Vogelbacteria bacterium]
MASKKKKLDIDQVIEMDRKRKRERSKRHQQIIFKEYLDLVRVDPLIAELSPSRLFSIIMDAGMEIIPPEERFIDDRGIEIDKKYRFFSDKLFGVEASTYRFMEWLTSAKDNQPIGKMICVLVGPTASGKSSFASRLKTGLENFDKRKVYCIKGCPKLEEPLHLLPRSKREEFQKDLGVKIKGDLCPVCRYRLLHEFKDADGVVRWWDVPVETFTFSIQGKRGIGSFEPSDEKSQSVTDLVGKENVAVTSNPNRGYDDPFAFSLSGEIEKGEKGIVEGREIFKKGIDERLLWVFINVAEEGEIKVQGSNFPHISTDVVVLGHCNIVGFKDFASNQAHEALHDRTFVIPFPYPLRVKDEIKVYRKLMNQDVELKNLKECHIAPGALEVAALFAIATRVNPTTECPSRVQKAKIYDQQEIQLKGKNKGGKIVNLQAMLSDGQSDHDISKREGMFGVSSRDIMTALNTAVAREGETGCLTPNKVIRALMGAFKYRMGYTPEELSLFKEVLVSEDGEGVTSEYNSWIVERVSHAFLGAHSDFGREMFEKYIEEASLWRKTKRKYALGAPVDLDPITKKPRESNLKYLESIEVRMGLSSSEAETARGEILELRGELLARGKEFSYDNYPPLKEAINTKLMEDCRPMLTMMINSDRLKNPEIKKRSADLIDSMKAMGHCDICIKEALEDVKKILV